MTLRLAVRSLAARPLRSAVLAGGFGFGIAVMAALTGVSEVVLEQAASPHLGGGGDLVLFGRPGRIDGARWLLAHLVGGAAGRAAGVGAASPSRQGLLYLVGPGGVLPVRARGGVPSLERALGDAETAAVAAWRDAADEERWTAPDPAGLLRELDRFHAVPGTAPGLRGSWAEWLYFNGRAEAARFTLSFLAGAPGGEGGRVPVETRLVLEEDGTGRAFSRAGTVDGARLLARAPDLDFPGATVDLAGLRYRVCLELDGEAPGERLEGEIELEALPGGAVPPLVLHGARGWLSGYAVPVLSGALAGELRAGGVPLALAGGRGYHDHNWGFWRGVTWQWGQAAGDEVAAVWGRVRPPGWAADAERVPGFLALVARGVVVAALADVSIEETDGAPGEAPRRIRVSARRGQARVEVAGEIDSARRTRTGGGGPEALDFLQMRGRFAVRGAVAGRRLDFTAPGAAETFRGAAP